MCILERAKVLRNVVGRLRKEVVQREEKESRGESEPPEDTVAGEDGTGESRNSDIEDAGCEGLVGGNQRLYPGCIRRKRRKKRG